MVKKGWHTEPSLSQSDGRTKPRHHLSKSPFFSLFRCFLPAVAGKCLKPSPKPMALLIPASKFILSENTVMSMKNRTKADLRQRDLSTGVTVAHGRFFCLLWRIGSYTLKEGTNGRQGGCRAINATMQFGIHLQCCNLHFEMKNPPFISADERVRARKYWAGASWLHSQTNKD